MNLAIFRLALLAVLAAPIIARAELRTDDLDGIKIGMTPDEVEPLIAKIVGAGEVTRDRTLCHVGDQLKVCYRKIYAEVDNWRAEVSFIEDLPANPGTMRAYAARETVTNIDWTEADRAKWDAQTEKDAGRPDCAVTENGVRTRAWSTAGGVDQCKHQGADLPRPGVNEDALVDQARSAGASPLLSLVLSEVTANDGSVQAITLADFGFYAARRDAAAAYPVERRIADLDQLRIGMTPEQADAILAAIYPHGKRKVTEVRCDGGRKTCTADLYSATSNDADMTKVYFVEDLPTSPGVMRLYAVDQQIINERWTANDTAARDALEARFRGAPDCVSSNDKHRIRAWSAGGKVDGCANDGDQLPAPEAGIFPGMAAAAARINDVSPFLYPVLAETTAIDNDVRYEILIDLGFLEPRKKAGGAMSAR